MKIICFLKTIWYTSKHFLMGGNEIVEGHIYKTQEILSDRVVFIDKCEDCGHTFISHCGKTELRGYEKRG